MNWVQIGICLGMSLVSGIVGFFLGKMEGNIEVWKWTDEKRRRFFEYIDRETDNP